MKDRQIASNSAQLGPRLALVKSGLKDKSFTEKEQWKEAARVDAVLGASRLSLKSVRSGIRCFLTFAGPQHMVFET